MRIWSQTLLPSVITSTLYFAIFGTFLGDRIGAIQGVPYIAFIVPGLVMLAVITNSYSNVVSSFFGAKFQKNLEELMVAPVPHAVVILGYVLGGALRGFAVGILSLGVALFFARLPVAHLGIVLLFFVLTAVLFALAGLVNGVYAKGFDSISIFPTFVLTPLTYLGGIFYPITVLPPFWQTVSQLNPILYMVNGFRYGFLGVSDMSVWVSIVVLALSILVVSVGVWWLFTKGYGLRS